MKVTRSLWCQVLIFCPPVSSEAAVHSQMCQLNVCNAQNALFYPGGRFCSLILVSVRPSVRLSVRPSVCLSVCLSLRLPLSLSVCLSGN